MATNRYIIEYELGICYYCCIFGDWGVIVSERYCPNCGSFVAEGAKYCAECGARISSSYMDDPVRSHKKRKKGKGKRVLLIILCILLILVGILYYLGSKYVYSENFKQCIYDVMQSAVDVENAGNTIRKVWANSIYQTSDPETDKYTRADGGSGEFYPEFDTALDTLFSDSAFILSLHNIAAQRDNIAALMKQLSNPPSSFAADYNDLKKMYVCYQEFANLVLNTSGSLESFSESFSSADENLLKAYYPLSAYIY